MKLIKKDECIVYEAKNHFNNWSSRKIGPNEGSSNLTFSISEFLPGGGAAMSANPDKEKLYYVLRGNIEIKDENGNKYEMEEGDTIYIPAGEKREMIATGNISARVIVVMCAI